jgi:hypothetical protein
MGIAVFGMEAISVPAVVAAMHDDQRVREQTVAAIRHNAAQEPGVLYFTSHRADSVGRMDIYRIHYAIRH